MITLLGVLFGGIFIGIPVAYAVAISGMAYLVFESTVPLLVVAQRMVVGVDSFTLLAIPLFVLAGALMAEGDITPRLMKFASNMVGHIPGGLAMVMVVSCMLFGAISGSGVANVVAIGSILLPTMKEQGYEPPFSAALLGCAEGRFVALRRFPGDGDPPQHYPGNNRREHGRLHWQALRRGLHTRGDYRAGTDGRLLLRGA